MKKFLAAVILFHLGPAICATGNVAKNTDFERDGIGGIVNWACIRPGVDGFELLDERGPEGGRAVRLRLSEKGGFQQDGMKYVDGEPYSMSAWVRTKNLKPGSVSLIVYDDWLHISRNSDPFPSDTGGKWVKVEWTGEMFVNVKNARCYFGLQATAAMGEDAVLDFADPSLVPLSEKARRGTKSPVVMKPFASRVVPIDPKLSEVDSDDAGMTFFYPGDFSGAAEVSVEVDGLRTGSAPLGKDRRARISLGRPGEGRHRLKATVSSGGRILAADEYTITARRRLKGAQAGRRLNNFVVELPVERDPYGFYFNAPEKGWYYMSCDGPKSEKMQFLDAGRHPVPLPAVHGAKVSVRAIKRIHVGGLCATAKKTDLARQDYGIDFCDRFIIPSMNVMSMWEWERKNHSAEMRLFEERCIPQTYSVSMHSSRPEWTDAAAICKAVTNCNGYLEGMMVSLDESAIQCPRRVHNAIAEALWSMADRRDLRLNLFYNDTMRRVFTDDRMSPSVLAALANVGDGTGVLLAEAYSAALPTLEETRRKGEDFYVKFQQSVEKMAPCAAGSVIYHQSGYVSPYLWCTYPACTADYKVFFADMVRRFATDPAFGKAGGLSVSAFMRCDEELVRWFMRVFRYYGIEGRTGDICKEYAFTYHPGHLRNADFTSKLEGWSAAAAPGGAIEARRIKGFAQDHLQFRECERSYGDDLVVFRRSAKAPNVLSQKITALRPGRYYFLSALTLDMDDVKNPGSVRARSAFSVDVKGAEVVPGLKWANVFPPSLGPDRRRYRGKPISAHTTDRLVFKALSDTATVSFSDWSSTEAPGGRIGGETVLTYVICRPYYIENGQELEEIAARWGVKGDSE